MSNLTKEQTLAVNEEGKNIIVSAGAGSGKTMVLSTRVIRKIKDGTDIDHMLILTFTIAAANEMKARIRKNIKKNNLLEQLNKLDNSYITTFDSFFLSLVKKYHYVLNINKNVNIIESNILELKIKEYLNDILEEEYLKKDEYFTKLINDFCIKDDDEIRKAILSIYNKLNMKYNKVEYLNNYLDYFYSDTFIDNKIREYENYLKEKIEDYNILLTKLSNVTDADYFSKVIASSNDLLNSNTYKEIRENILKLEIPRLPNKSGEEATNIKNDIKKLTDEIKNLTENEDIISLKNDIQYTSNYTKPIIDIIKKLDDKINEYKKKNDLYDFVDINKMAIKIVKENENIRNEIKYYFNEIMVDEYQDTSDLQEELITLISNNNLYMVGDIKQSIYRFRNANPTIFKNKYDNYAKGNNGLKIDLLNNFRSREEVLDNINLLFKFIMSDDIGGANYIKDHQMIFGNTSYNQEGKTIQDNNMEIYHYDKDNDLLKKFKKEEIEAFIIARDIKEKVENHYQIFDKDEKILKDITYNDFSILIDRSTNFELYKKIFLYFNIPLSIYKDETLTNSDIFSVINSIIKFICIINDKPNLKDMNYLYLSIGRSFLFNIDDDTLFKVITLGTVKDTLIYQMINDIAQNIDNKTITNLLDEIIIKFDFYNKLRTIPNIRDNYTKIEYLYTLSNTLNKMGYTYKDFTGLIEEIFNSEKEIKFSVSKEENNSVKLMTIHHSKGLEYHICYFPGLYKQFNFKDILENFNYSKRLGIITPIFNDGISKTFYDYLNKNDYYNDEISEKIRLFYVAVTRAKEKMIFISSMKDKYEEYDKSGIVSDNIRRKYRTFDGLLESIKSHINPYIKEIDLNSLNLSKDYNLINSNNIFGNINNIQDKINIYNYELKETSEITESHYSKSNIKLITKEERDVMDFGTMMHYLLETMDLVNPDYTGIDDKYVNYIKKFLNNDLVKDIKKAKIYQEYEFIHQEEDNISHGIIDLMLEYSDHIDIIDYKLKHIDDPAYIKQLTGYQDYIKSLKNKPVNIYLYSIIDNIYKKLN